MEQDKPSAEFCYLVHTGAREYILALKVKGQAEQRIQITESQLRLMIADGAAMAYRYAKREEAWPEPVRTKPRMPLGSKM